MSSKIASTLASSWLPSSINRRQCVGGLLAAGLMGSSAARLFAAQPVAAKAAKKNPSVLLYSGWATTNIGDIGHTPGTLRYLEQYFPEARVTCWLRKFNPEIVAMIKRRFPSVPVIEGGTISAQGQATSPELQSAFDSADLLLYNSGMHFTRFWAPPAKLLSACIARNKPYGLYGQSFDGIRNQDAEIVPKLLSHASFIFCRDTESLTYLRSTGIRPGVLEFGPDGCFGIDVRDDAKAAAFLRENHLEPRKFIVVILRSDKEISKNPNDEMARIPGGPEEWSAKLREVIVNWTRRTGMKTVLVAEAEKEIAAEDAMIFQKLPEDVRSHVVLRKTFWNSDEAVSFLSHAHTLINVEPHASIMALSVGTPTIHFFSRSHGSKAYMFRDIGLPEWLISIDTEPASRVTEALDRIDAHYDLAQAKVKRAMASVHARSAEMMSDVRRAASREV